MLLLWSQLYTTLKLGKLQDGSWRTGAASNDFEESFETALPAVMVRTCAVT